ncbi:hypothetical protein KsCSTR_14410 [Candidatus Kuenenia stuttgartiensis]|uniref:Uncharacterized protein n=1 Tax=Kuenenia stuttgartiensis TaxID=174633 RepID=Q1Q1B4_KUEST|nr:hypothetical protein KsCSTR_14410 [Candidatus Kuenenia stuttgartiensis]CAJ73791.1 unknown protein [Candidatus Kuenenia stuttgartiensis]
MLLFNNRLSRYPPFYHEECARRCLLYDYQVCKPEPNILYFQSRILLAEQMKNKFRIPNRDFVIWALEFYCSI